MERHANAPNKLVLKVDFKNAFNNVNREAACTEHAPKAATWAWWCYSQPSTLHYEGRTITSCSRVQQGDNLGHLLFALALQPVLEQISELRQNHRHKGLDIVAAYLDDVVYGWLKKIMMIEDGSS